MAVASVTASQLNGDALARIRSGDEDTAAFIRIRDQLRRAKEATPDILYLYTMRRDGDAVLFVVDGDYGYADDAAPIGEPYPEAEPELLLGFAGPSADTEFTTDEWGTVLSGFAPVRDSAGTVVGIVGVDMESSVVLEKLNAVHRTLYILWLFALVSVAAGVGVIERRRARDEKHLAESEKKYRTLFEMAGDCILIFEAEGGEQGRIIDANTAAAEMHGYTAEELKGMKITDLDTEESRRSAPERFERVLRGELLEGEAVHVRKDGTRFPIEINSRVLSLGDRRYVFAIDRDISERKRAEEALQLATRKLNLLNQVTFSDIKNVMFSLSGYIELQKHLAADETSREYLEKQAGLVRQVEDWIRFAEMYQGLGLRPPAWQNVEHAFIYGISHLDFSGISRSLRLDNLEIYADPLLETVFFSLAENVIEHAATATEVSLRYRETDEGLTLIFEDNGAGIPGRMKEAVFERQHERKKGLGLFLVREILSITGIDVCETGSSGSGARFEIHIPRNGYRFAGSAPADT